MQTEPRLPFPVQHQPQPGLESKLKPAPRWHAPRYRAAGKLEGKAAYLREIRKSFHRHAVGHHNGHQPEIQMQGEDEATGIWYLADHMWVLDGKFYTTGTALYWDRYQKQGGRWKIRETRYRRIYEITYPIDQPPPFAVRYLAQHGSESGGPD